MTRPVLVIAAAGVLGGAERVVLDWASALEPPVVLACPLGPLADCAAQTGIEIEPLPDRPLRLRGRRVRAALELGGLARDVARLARDRRPRVVVTSGRRPLLAAGTAPLGGAPLLAILHDLAPRAPLGTLLRGATARSGAVVATSGAIARAADPRGRRLGRTHVVHPGVDQPRGRCRIRRPARPARAVPRRARPVEARRPGARDRRAHTGAPARRRRCAAGRRPAGLRRRAARAGRAAGPRRARALPRRARRPPPGDGFGALPPSLRGPRAVRPGARRGARRRQAGGGARCGRPARDRHARLRAAVSAGRRRGRRRRAAGRARRSGGAGSRARAGACVRPPARRARRFAAIVERISRP